MKLPYPQSINCSFEGFPALLNIRLGPLAATVVEGCSLGSKFSLTQTPKSGVPQGEYVAGEVLPECRKIYTDTGSDDNYAIKVSFFGWGSFYKVTDEDEYLRFQLYNAISIETPIMDEMVFGDVFDCETLIPSDTSTTALFDYEGHEIEYKEQTTSGTDEAGGYAYINGQKVYIPADSSIEYIGSSSGPYTVSVINGTVVIS